MTTATPSEGPITDETQPDWHKHLRCAGCGGNFEWPDDEDPKQCDTCRAIFCDECWHDHCHDPDVLCSLMAQRDEAQTRLAAAEAQSRIDETQYDEMAEVAAGLAIDLARAEHQRDEAQGQLAALQAEPDTTEESERRESPCGL